MAETNLQNPNQHISPMQPTWSTVTSFNEESPSCFTLRIAHSYPFLPPRPGQFNMLYAFAVGEVPISVSRMEDSNTITVHTIRDVGAVTRALHGLRPGDQVGVRGPFGTPWPVDKFKDHDFIVIAGGIGLAPVRPIIDTFLAQNNRASRLSLFYGARTPEEILFAEELDQWQTKDEINVAITVDAATRNWRGQVGFVTDLLTAKSVATRKSVAFICGPEIMMLNCARKLQNLGLAAENIFLSMERNMKCALGWCGHCQYGGDFICKDGPVFSFPRIANKLTRREF